MGAIRRGYNNEQTATVDDVRIITRNKQRGTYDVAVTLTAQPAKNTGALNKPGVAVVSLFMIAGGIALSAYVLGVLKETLDEVQEFTTISVGDTKFNFAGLAGLVAVGLAAKFLWKGKLA